MFYNGKDIDDLLKRHKEGEDIIPDFLELVRWVKSDIDSLQTKEEDLD